MIGAVVSGLGEARCEDHRVVHIGGGEVRVEKHPDGPVRLVGDDAEHALPGAARRRPQAG